MTPEAAAGDIVRSPEFTAKAFSGWGAPGRIGVNARAIDRSDRGETGRMSGRERMGLPAPTGSWRGRSGGKPAAQGLLGHLTAREAPD